MEPEHLEDASTTRDGLPDEVTRRLEYAQYLHLATCSNNIPHLSLMNYSYFPSTPYSSNPIVIMTTPTSSRKTQNIASNPHVSLLIHDWAQHRAPRGHSPGPYAEMLYSMNYAELGKASTSINGMAELIPCGSEQEVWYKAQHLANNASSTHRDSVWLCAPSGGATEPRSSQGEGRQAAYPTSGEEIRVVVVRVRDGKFADEKGQMWNWSLTEGSPRPQINGITS